MLVTHFCTIKQREMHLCKVFAISTDSNQYFFFALFKDNHA